MQVAIRCLQFLKRNQLASGCVAWSEGEIVPRRRNLNKTSRFRQFMRHGQWPVDFFAGNFLDPSTTNRYCTITLVHL